MSQRLPSEKQMQALRLLGATNDHAAVLAECGVTGSTANRAMFIMRLLDRGWVRLAITAEGTHQVDADQWDEEPEVL